MKRIIVCAAAVFTFTLQAWTQTPEQNASCSAPPPACHVKASTCQTAETEWDFLQFGFWFDVPSSTVDTEVYGIKIGAPFCSGKAYVRGIETAVFCGASDNVSGLQACILASVSKKMQGLQFSIVNYSNEVSGLQLGVLNIAKDKSFQIGILNHIEGAAIPWLPVFNFKF